MASAIAWIDDVTFELGGVRFHLDLARERPLASERLVLMKDRPLVETYERVLAPRAPRRVMEIGIWGGGGTIFLERLLEPERLVAVDRTEDRVPLLDRTIEELGLETRVSCHYGLWQEQSTRLGRVADQEFGGKPIDLVVDDSSHLLEPTRACFNALFPRLAPGGLFVVEDWAWAHWPGHYQEGVWLEREPLTNLVFDAVLVTASDRRIVSSVHVEPGLVAIERGPARLDPATFDVTKSWRGRGKTLAWV